MLLARQQVKIDGRVVTDGSTEISRFQKVQVAEVIVQQGRTAIYLMMNKPVGYLSATFDPQHPTVMDFLPEPLASELHIGGRLDKASSGLLVLTNDGLWSRRLTAPALKKPKVYQVITGNPIDPGTAEQFAQGIYFPYEDVTTSPAELQQTSPREAILTIYEGRYHQIKRMFGRFRNPVISLHRQSMGAIQLDPSLQSGQFRHLTAAEVASV